CSGNSLVFGRQDPEKPIEARISALNARRERPLSVAAERSGASKEKLAEITVESARALVQPAMDAELDPALVLSKGRGELARIVDELLRRTLEENHVVLPPLQHRDLITLLLNSAITTARA